MADGGQADACVPDGSTFEQCLESVAQQPLGLAKLSRLVDAWKAEMVEYHQQMLAAKPAKVRISHANETCTIAVTSGHEVLP